jgi:type I restriction enzyme, R subunit
MNIDNFVVRPHRRVVERFQSDGAWTEIDDDARHELLDEVAPLPSEQQLGTEPAKRFDLLMLNLQLALLKQSKSFERLRKQLLLIAAALEEQFSIPIVAQQQELILEIQTDPWWEGVTAPLLELVRLRLRNLVQHIDRTKQRLVYTDFEDELGAGASIDLPQIGAVDFNRFKRKARHWLLEHDDNLTLQKLRRGKPLTKLDLDQLGRLLVDDGVGDQVQIDKATELSQGLGRFIRSLVGLERDAVAETFSTFVSEGNATARQIEFIDLIIEHLTEKGTMDPRLLYESPFTDLAPQGPEQVFDFERAKKLVDVISSINETAVG